MTQQQQVESQNQQALPPLPAWPTSAPGPKVTPPPAGTRRLHERSEQVVEVDYDHEQGRSTVREGL